MFVKVWIKSKIIIPWEIIVKFIDNIKTLHKQQSKIYSYSILRTHDIKLITGAWQHQISETPLQKSSIFCEVAERAGRFQISRLITWKLFNMASNFWICFAA